MSSLMHDKDNDGLQIELTSATTTLEKLGDAFKLTLLTGNNRVAVQLTPSALQALGLQCVAHMPDIAPQYAVASVEEAARLPARALRELDDRSIQLLLREIDSGYLIDFLWYMKDGALIRLFLRNCSQRLAAMMMEDMATRWGGKDPDTTLEVNTRRGREALEEILKLARRLIDEGQIPDVLGLEIRA